MAMQQCLFATVELQTFPNIYSSLSKLRNLYHFSQREWFYGTMSLATIKTSCCPHVKDRTFVFNFSQIWIFPTDLNKSSQNQISCASIKWEPRCYMWKNRRMKGQTTQLTGTFCEYANMCKTCYVQSILLLVLQYFLL